MSKAAPGGLKCQLLHLTWLRHALWHLFLYHIRAFLASQHYFSGTEERDVGVYRFEREVGTGEPVKKNQSAAVEIPRSRPSATRSPSSLTLGKNTSIATIIRWWLQPLSQFPSSSASPAIFFLTHRIHNSCGMKWCRIIKCTWIFVGWNLNRAGRWRFQPGWMAVSC